MPGFTIPVDIDIGFGEVIYPERVKMEYPTLLDDAAPAIKPIKRL